MLECWSVGVLILFQTIGANTQQSQNPAIPKSSNPPAQVGKKEILAQRIT